MKKKIKPRKQPPKGMVDIATALLHDTERHAKPFIVDVGDPTKPPKPAKK